MIHFNATEEYLLEDEAVVLRPLTREDEKHLLHFSLNEPTIWRFSLVQANGRDNLVKYLDIATTARAEKKEYPFIVFDKRTQQYAGSTRFYDIQEANSSLQLGYTWYGKDFQGTGLNKHCKMLLLDFAFNAGFERVEFRADNDNERSIAAMKSIGCTVEGVLRSHGLKPDGTRRDTIILSILKKEWEEGKREELKRKIEQFDNEAI